MLQKLKDLFKDVFYDPANEHFDGGRAMAYCAFLSVIGALAWNMHLHQPVALTDLSTALGTLLTALVVYIYHDRKNNDTNG